ncbi:DinB family protein [Oceanobacillus sp. FSL K6-2867]|uniref:DinB family protein n=1 Tax=Oceanobacillus sp. FSL K6-2867 TaxID=2954748 RepID=UPI0030DA9B55
MYRIVKDFVNDWDHAAKGTIAVLESLTDDKLNQAIVEGHSTLGWLGWHLAASPVFFSGLVGVEVDAPETQNATPEKASEIVEVYKKVTTLVKEQVEQNVTDEMLEEEVDAMGGSVARGALLRTLIDHQTHHRGQMTVLLRQAGLRVPGVMGPTKEDR